LTLTAALAACATPAPAPWQKMGADPSVIARDTDECHTAARQEAARLYPQGFSSPTFGASANVMSQQRDETQRMIAESGAFDACMQDKGYVRMRQETDK
jgi:hypothetical protein